jgi:hypothetical protein
MHSDGLVRMTVNLTKWFAVHSRLLRNSGGPAAGRLLDGTGYRFDGVIGRAFAAVMGES